MLINIGFCLGSCLLGFLLGIGFGILALAYVATRLEDAHDEIHGDYD